MTTGARLWRGWDAALTTLVAAGYVLMVVVGFAQVVFRFVLAQPLSWSEELVRYVFVWSVFLTAALAFNSGLHIRIDFLTERYPPRVRRAATLLSWVCTIAAVGILLVLGVELAGSPSVRLQKSPAMEIPMTVPYAAIPVGSAMMMVNVLRAAWRSWKGEEEPAAHLEVA